MWPAIIAGIQPRTMANGVNTKTRASSVSIKYYKLRFQKCDLRETQYENKSPILLCDGRVLTRIEPSSPGMNMSTHA